MESDDWDDAPTGSVIIPVELVDELIHSVFDIIKEWSDENDVKLDRMQCMGAIVAMSRMCMSTLMEYPSEGGTVQ